MDLQGLANALVLPLRNWFMPRLSVDDGTIGTWTPTYYGATTAGTTAHSVQQGTYVRIGPVVMFTAFVVWSSATGTGEARISLPFTAAPTANQLYAVSVRTYDVTFGGAAPQAFILNSDNQIIFEYPRTNTSSARLAVESAGQILVTGMYFIG